MRNSALVSVVLLGVLGGPAHAEHDGASPAVTTGRPRTERIASLGGALAITGAIAREPLAARVTAGEPGPATSHPASERYLSASDISAQVAPYVPEIERCYLTAVGDPRRTAQLDLMFVIARQGEVLSLDIAAPSVSVRKVHKIASCIRTAVEALRFPERRNGTTAILPYLFQRTEAPDAGPQPSCWNPKGCRN
jgi:hypothetical protein